MSVNLELDTETLLKITYAYIKLLVNVIPGLNLHMKMPMFVVINVRLTCK
jgi:hypothetical protein